MMNISCLRKKKIAKRKSRVYGKRKVSKAENLGDETCLVSYLSFKSKLLSVSVLVVSNKKKNPSDNALKIFSYFLQKKFPFYARDGNRKKNCGIRYRIFTVCCLNKAAEKKCFIFTQF